MMCRAVALALVALMGSVSARTPVCALTDSCGKPKSAFPKLDKAACEKKYPSLDSFTCDMLDMTKRVCVQGHGAFTGLRTFPSKCVAERFICQHLMDGKPNPPEYLFDGPCTLQGSGHCPLCAVRPPAPMACAQLGDKPTKGNLKVYKDSCQAMMISSCAIPGLKTVKMDVCTQAGVKYLPPAPVMPAFEKKCRDLMLTCNPKMRGIKVCGDDQTTYSDECSLNFENCMKTGKSGQAKLVKMVYQGQCAQKCDANTPCPSGQNCVGTCVPDGLDVCAPMEKGCASQNKRCFASFNCPLMAACQRWTRCGPPIDLNTPHKCDLNNLAGCIKDATQYRRSMTPCGLLVAYSACAINTRCISSARRFCTSGITVNTGGGTSKEMVPPNCAAPACALAQDKKCKVGEYQKCRDAALQIADLCKSYEADAKCIADTNCNEDLEATCYMAKWDGCKGGTLETVCKASQSPIKELEEQHRMMYEYARLPARRSPQQGRGGLPLVVAGAACAALLAVGLAAFAVHHRRRAGEEAPAADYQAVEGEI